jgi:hypothetical protein
MDGIYFALGNIAVCVIIYWAMVNDHARLAGRTRGLAAMPEDDPVSPVATSSHRSGYNRRTD